MNVSEMMINSLKSSIDERIAKICDTWDYNAVMSAPWGVKEEIDIAKMDEYQKFFEDNEQVLIDEYKIIILKYGIKERNGVATLIYRYQLELWCTILLIMKLIQPIT